MKPDISVLMGIYNCESTLEEAVRSIQAQTYENWQLILCDDGSSDGTYATAERLQKEDSRIVLLRNERNLGLNETLNKCLQAADGEYIARMDGDDLSTPDRFETQLSLLRSKPEYDITSSPMILFDENGEWGHTAIPEYPTPEQVVTGSPISHAPVMMRKKCMDEVGGYTVDRRALRVEDVDLWIKLYAHGYRCCNIQRPLYKMRNDQNALNRRKYIYRINSTYTRLQGCKKMNLSLRCRLKAFYPMVCGLVPAGLRTWVRRKIGYR